MPGFVDCHVHYPQIDIVGSYGEQLLEWLQNYVFPAEAQYKDVDYANKVDLYVYLYLYLYLYLYIYTYIHTYVHIYIYIYIHADHANNL